MSMIQQNVFMFDDSIKENIKLFANYSDEEVLNICDRSGLSNLISRLPDGINSLVGENGNRLSGGEKQRIAIARCMLRDPQILLLDEATSALDKNVEEEVQKSLDVLMQGRTSIVIAHRLSTIVNSHKIFFIEQGEIKEEGTHEELLAKQGRYHSLYMSGQKK